MPSNPPKSGSLNKVQFVDIDADQAGQRIDNFLRTFLKGAPKALIYRLLRKGEIRVNKKRTKPDYKLQAMDQIRIAPIRLPEKGESAPVSDQLLELLERSVVYETDSLLIINKPSGIAVHGGSGVSLGLIEAVRKLRPDARFLELIHRIDRDTSGCIMIAKKRSMLRFMHDAFRERRVHKIYQALVVGRWDAKSKQVNAPCCEMNINQVSGLCGYLQRVSRLSPISLYFVGLVMWQRLLKLDQKPVVLIKSGFTPNIQDIRLWVMLSTPQMRTTLNLKSWVLNA